MALANSLLSTATPKYPLPSALARSLSGESVAEVVAELLVEVREVLDETVVLLRLVELVLLDLEVLLLLEAEVGAGMH